MVNPVIGSGNIMQQRGKLGAYKQDLLAHRDGTGFRQEASTVDMTPPLMFFPGANVRETLESIELYLLNDNCYISIGDGVNSFGTFNIGDPGIPTVEAAFAAAMATSRLTNGGIIQLKSGQYNFQTTVTLNAGISVLGEFSTIINCTTANRAFRISECPTDTVRIAPSVQADGHKVTRLFKLTFFDGLSDASPYLNLSSFIICNRGSNLIVEQCSVFGKIGPAGAPPPVTRHFIAYDTGTTSIYNSILHIENCQVSAVQQVVDFDTEVSRSNKLYVRNNRFWVSGKLGVPTIKRATAAVTFRACDATLSHNQIWFGLNAVTLQTIRTAFSCYDPGAVERNLVIIGNQGHFYTSSLADTDNRLISEDTFGLLYMRAAISGNVMGGASDSNTWYIVVGDGDNTVGDINGRYALQNIVRYFYSMNLGAEHGGVVIYVKYGSYTIDNTSIFEPPASATATGIPLAMIGVPDNGNFPIVSFDVAVPAVNGQEMMFGHHIENIHFTGRNNYYKILARNDFANPDARTPFYRNIVIKNCSFKNCSIGTLPAAASVIDDPMRNQIFIEDCQFANTAIITNMANPEEMIAIHPSYKNGKIYVKRCYMVDANWRGNFFTLDTTVIDTYGEIQVEISDCRYTSVNNSAMIYPISISSVKDVVIENNVFDVSGATTQPNAIIAITASTDNTRQNKLIFRYNHLIGDSAAVQPASGLLTAYFDNHDSSYNTFENLAYGIYSILDYSGITTEVDTLNINVNNNRCIIGSTSYGFLLIDSNSGATNTVNGKVNVYNNSIDMQAKTAAVGYALLGAGNVFGPIAINLISTANVVVNVSENSIHDFTAVDVIAPNVECAIAVVGSQHSKIYNNSITFSSLSLTRNFYGIFVCPTDPGAAFAMNAQMTDISNNDMYLISSLIGFGRELDFIYVKNTMHLTITNNKLYRAAGSVTWFIRATEDSGIIGNQGVITDNVLSEDLGNGGIRYKNDGSHNNIRLYVARNKNQNIIHQVDCTDFMRYGYNRNTAEPYSDAVVLLKDKSLITAGALPANLNRHQLHIMADGTNGAGPIATWNTLESGLYYTNAYDGGMAPLSPCAFAGIYGPAYTASHTKHQILIPLRIPDYVKINRIDIPIYWLNTSGFNCICGAGASLICGNDIENTAKIEYITDTVSWENENILVLAGGESTLNLSNTTSFYLNPTRNTTGYSGISSDYLTSINCYILLSLYVVGVTAPITHLYFAIPYAKVSYLY